MQGLFYQSNQLLRVHLQRHREGGFGARAGRRKPTRRATSLLPAVQTERMNGLQAALPLLALRVEDAPAISGLEQRLPAFRAMVTGLHSNVLTITKALQLNSAHTLASDNGLTTYSSLDQQTSLAVQVAEGSRLAWFNASCLAMRDIGVVRVNAFPNATTRAPKLDVELFYWFGKINVYINLVPRANLMLDESYLTKYYRQPRWGPHQRSLFDLELQCMDDSSMTPFRSRSPDTRIIAGGTALMHSADATPENSAKMLALADEATSMWLDMMSEAESALTPEERRALAALDEVLLSYSRRDGENAKLAAEIGGSAMEEVSLLTTRDPRILHAPLDSSSLYSNIVAKPDYAVSSSPARPASN